MYCHIIFTIRIGGRARAHTAHIKLVLCYRYCSTSRWNICEVFFSLLTKKQLEHWMIKVNCSNM